MRTRGSRYSCRTTQIKIFALPVQTPMAWLSLSAKLFTQFSPLPVQNTSHEFVFRVCYSGCDWISQLCVTRDEDESRSYSLLFHGFLMSLVIWERRVKTIGCLSLKGKAEFSSHPPTLTVPCSSIDHRSLIIGSNLDRELLLLILAFHSLRLRLNSWMLPVVILLKYAFPFLVVQLLWWWLFSTCSSWKFLSYNLSTWLPSPSQRTVTRRRCG